MNQPVEPFLAQLRHDLGQDLPGRAAQYRMAPQPRSGGSLPYDEPSPNARQSSVLILLYPHQDTLFLPLILRPTYNGVHSGQVSFPGGGREPGDPDLVATALREAQEEIGISVREVTVLGQLSPLYIYVSNNLVYPIVAWSAQRPNFHPDPQEVAQLVEIPLIDLLNPANRYEEEWQLRDRVATVRFYHVQGQKIWGATAMMISELLALPVIAGLLALGGYPYPPTRGG
jgi:8-oxo-dGTP pyrophosphatase MutT (NUDIX family)